MIIKVCGMRNIDNIKDAVRAGADWIGLIFWEKSPRYVLQHPKDNEPTTRRSTTNRDVASLKQCKRIGVFVNESPQNIITQIENYNLDIVQLHGEEDNSMIENMRKRIVCNNSRNVKIIKAISVRNEDDITTCNKYDKLVDYFLFDTKTPKKGGSGKHFDWDVLNDYNGETPFLLSGGIGPEDAVKVKYFNHPKLLGIDLNSKFETEPAMKDIEKLRLFINQIRQIG